MIMNIILLALCSLILVISLIDKKSDVTKSKENDLKVSGSIGHAEGVNSKVTGVITPKSQNNHRRIINTLSYIIHCHCTEEIMVICDSDVREFKIKCPRCDRTYLIINKDGNLIHKPLD